MSSRPNLRQVGRELHERLLAGELTATNEIAEVFLPILCSSLHRQFSNIGDLNMVDGAVTDALIGYFGHPERYDPMRAGLFTYLRLRAATNLLNDLAAQKRHAGTGELVEVESAKYVYEREASNLEDTLIEREVTDHVMQQLREILPDPLDQEIASLMIDGVRRTRDYAEKLGILGQSPDEQARIVKRHKDRIKVTLQRKYKTRGQDDEF